MKITFDQDLLERRRAVKSYDEVAEAASRKGLRLSSDLDRLNVVETASGFEVCRLVKWHDDVVLEVRKPDEFSSVMLLVTELESRGRKVEIRHGDGEAGVPGAGPGPGGHI